MKRILAIITFAAIACTFANARHTDEWKEKMRSEKIAFLTMDMNITPEEAQVFWPVYNQVEQQKDAALGEVIQAYKALNAAVESNENVEKCLNAYLQAQDKLREIDSKAAQQYKAVLPIEKVAKLYTGEEKFRRQHIRNLRNNQANK